MSLYELLSTTVALDLLRDKEEGAGRNKPGPAMSEEDWERSMNAIRNLARFDPSLRVE